MSNKIKIAISGKSGCGNSTVSRLVSANLQLRLINYTFHSIAIEEGVSFEEICSKAELDTAYDLRVDKVQVEMANRGNCVLGSRLAIWLLESADFRIYLEAGAETRAQRVHEREGGEYSEVLVQTQERDRRDRARYLKLYSIDINEYKFADTIIDTEANSQHQIADIITRLVHEKICI